MTSPLKNLLRSATDPLKQGPQAGRILAERFSKEANGFSREHVTDAAWSVMLDNVRQSCATREQAHAKLSEMAARMHAILDEHYDSVTGRRRSIFAYDQNINVVFTDDRKRD